MSSPEKKSALISELTFDFLDILLLQKLASEGLYQDSVEYIIDNIDDLVHKIVLGKIKNRMEVKNYIAKMKSS